MATPPWRVHCQLDPLGIREQCLGKCGGMWIAWMTGWCMVALFLWSQIGWIRTVDVQQTHHPHRIEQYEDFTQLHPLRELEREEKQHKDRYGNPFSYRQSSAAFYPSIPFGYPYQIASFPTSIQNASHILCMILSHSQHDGRRRVLRRFYQNQRRMYNVSYFFVLGRNDSVWHSEAIVYRDILQLDHIESYHNLSLAVANALQTLYDRRVSFDYLLKTDDDCVVNLEALVPIINERSLRRLKYLYAGNCNVRSTYNTQNRTEKNYVPSDLVQTVQTDHVIPSYATGAAYVLSAALIPPLLLELRFLPFLTHQEDVTMGRAVHRAGLGCLSPKPGFWVSRNGCQHVADCRSSVVIHVPQNDSALERVCSFFLV